ncbi:Eukaryotic translation initiation factor 2-alpha kinase [Entomortierella chlamydospora]|uniref:Eukaryotic translation initiation factor 2-alpha kinase 1 n=1 Tax=Entomortierella chlamydospora TaxID=101097 RepID=A0A9P6MX55_9FUNG|nr:Eukaryotic translation initiation factor 2-alpha kinase [Entomortierella chlamydospora]
MADKDSDEPSDDRPTSVNISSWSRRSRATENSRIRIGIDSRGTDISPDRFGRCQETQLDHGPQSTLSFRPGRRDRGLMRNTTVMTFHSDSEQEHEGPPFSSLLGRRGERLMRTTTVMTLQSGSDNYDEESNSDSNFDNSQSSFSSDRQGHSRVDIGLARAFRDVNSRDPTNSRSHRFVWPGPGTSDDDQTTSDDDENTDSAAQGSHIDIMIQSDCGDDEGQIDEDEDEEESRRPDMSNVLGSYLLAPMGFDDDEGAASSHGIEGYSEAAERFQIFAGVNEFDESDQIGFDDNTYQVIPKSKRRNQERILENKRRQGRLLLVSLLDNFCLLYEQSPERNRKLFYVICKTLSNMGIIDEEYLEEMSAVRSSYQRAFRSLVLSALTSIKQEQMILESRRIMAPPSTPTGNTDRRRGGHRHDMGSGYSSQSISESFSSKGLVPSVYLHSLPVSDSSFTPPTSMMRTTSFGDMFDNDPTRYKHDFVEICKLGKGGFASVFKARNKLDGIEYAIKKIRLRGSSKVRYEKIFREIKFLARLDHKNVIRYYSSWLEHADYPVSRREMYYSGGDFDSIGEPDDDFDDEYGDEDEFTNTASMREDPTMPQRTRRRRSVDYFGPHAEQHPSELEDLSMGIVFGEDGEDEEDDGITFEETQGMSDLDEDDASRRGSVQKSYSLMRGEDMSRNYSVSSTLASRNIPGALKRNPQRQKHKSPTVSQELDGVTQTWEETEASPSKARSNMANSFSTLSSSIEEIQRSLPSSYSGLGSRSQPRNHTLAALGGENELQPFTFPNLRESDRSKFAGGDIGGVNTQGRGDRGNPRTHRNSHGQLVSRDLTLFIQMQLCQTTLQDYLVYRNERPVLISRSNSIESNKKLAKASFLGIPSSSVLNDQKTQSAPGSPLQQTCHRDLVDPAVNQHIFRAIVEGVAYIHAQDMIHRDLKPGNIFLGMPAGVEHLRGHHSRLDNCNPDSLTSTSISSSQAGTLTTPSISSESPPNYTSTNPVQPPLTKEQIQEELFLNIESMVPKIGDFGLVTDMEGGATLDDDNSSQNTIPVTTPTENPSSAPLMRRHSSTVTTGSRSSRTRTTAVGTVTYASPEQLARPNLGYDQKADIYSLGIIFFELYHPFSTLMERHAVLRTLRNGELPPDFVSRWPKEAAFVLWLMAEDPRLRPTASEILEFDLIRKQKEEPIILSAATNPGPTSVAVSTETESPGIKKTSEAFCGLGLDSPVPVNPNIVSSTGMTIEPCVAREICEACQSRCQCSEPAVATAVATAAAVNAAAAGVIDNPIDSSAVTNSGQGKTRHQKGHRSSKSVSGKISRADLEQRLKEESEKVQRLEMSMAAMRAENKALLDRIQALEYEKEMSWASGRRSVDRDCT